MSLCPVIGIVIGSLINFLIGKKAKKAAEKLTDDDKAQLWNHFTVSHPRERLGASIFLVLLFCGGPISLLVFGFNDLIDFFKTSESLWEALWPTLLMLVIFLPLILLAIWCLLRAAVWKVQVDNERIVYTSLLGKKTEFTFKDVTLVKPYKTQTGQAIKVFVKDKKLFAVDPACKNYFIFTLRLADRNKNEQNVL